MTRPRLIVTDLDGTFLGPDQSVSPQNRAAARRAAELGIPFVIATGRPVRWLQVVDDLVEAHTRVIASNGAVVYDLGSQELVHSFTMDAATTLAVAEELRAAAPETTFGLETLTGFGCEPDAPSRQRGAPGVPEGSLAELVELLGPAVKLLAFHPDLATDEFAARALPVVDGRLTQTHAFIGGGYGLLEFAAPGVTKATTLARLCAELAVAAADVVAFGDMPNDLEMLSWAGRGYIVANAHPTLIKAGFTVVGANDADGVGRKVLELLQ